MKTNFESRYKDKLNSLAEKKKISEDQLSHFLGRGLQIIMPNLDFGLDSLNEYLPFIVIGASRNYISRMRVPYQGTSFIAANSRQDRKGAYIYKIPGKEGGGVTLLTNRKRKLGDSIFASTHRILMGHKAIMISATNLMINKSKIWNWEFFSNHLRKFVPTVYYDLVKLAEKKGIYRSPYCYVIIARSHETFRKLNIVEEYQRNRIAVLNPSNNVKVIFVTNQPGYDYMVKNIPESDLINYLVTGDQFDIYQAMLNLRKVHNIDMMLNDGGRQMSNGIRDAGLLAEERITLEPYPGEGILPSKLDPTSVLGMDGNGLDGTELHGAILVNSTKISDELANVYIYPLDKKKIF